MNQVFIPPDPLPEILRLPKCNLHTHLEGSVRPATFIELAQRQGLPLPGKADEVEDMLKVDGNEKSLADYLAKIAVNYPILKNPATLRRVAYEAAEDAFRDGVLYLELRFGPVTHVSTQVTLQACIESVLDGLHEAELKYGIICRLIVAALRHHDPTTNLVLARVAATYRDYGVVGFDLAGDEAAYPASLHQQALLEAREKGLGLTIHAGEASGALEVAYAIEVLGAQRIGHGVRSIESERVLQLLYERQILLEICPTSNLHTRIISALKQHPVRLLYEHKIPISINDDDPVTSRTCVSKELTLLHTYFGFSFAEIKQLQLVALDHSFLKDGAIRDHIRSQIMAYSFL